MQGQSPCRPLARALAGATLGVLALGVSPACAQTPAPTPPPVPGVPASVYAYPPNSDDRPMPAVVRPPAQWFLASIRPALRAMSSQTS